MKIKSVRKIAYIIIFLIALICSLLCLGSSPLFKGMPQPDSTVFQVMGRGVLRNQIMYSQLFDHKGPIVYFINALAIIINENIGLFVVELIFIYTGAIFVYKVSRRWISNTQSILVCCIYYLLIFVTLQGGNLTEEYAITFSAIALYYMFLILSEKDLKKKNWIIIGITFAINFFIKPTYIAIWIAFGITALIFFVKNKQYNDLLNGIKYALLGVIIITIPILCYIICQNCFNEFLDAYFITNFKYSNATITKKVESFIKLLYESKYYFIVVIAIIMNIIILFSKKIKSEIKVFINLFFWVTLILSATAPYANLHYLISNALPITIELVIIIILYKNNIIIPQILYYAVIAFIIILISCSDINIIKENNISELEECLDNISATYLDENDEILVLGNNSYYYLYLNKQPEFKYFFQIPIIQYNTEIIKDTVNYIETKKPKLIIDCLYGISIKQLLGSENEQIIEEYIYIEDKDICYWVLKE